MKNQQNKRRKKKLYKSNNASVQNAALHVIVKLMQALVTGNWQETENLKTQQWNHKSEGEIL